MNNYASIIKEIFRDKSEERAGNRVVSLCKALLALGEFDSKKNPEPEF